MYKLYGRKLAGPLASRSIAPRTAADDRATTRCTTFRREQFNQWPAIYALADAD